MAKNPKTLNGLRIIKQKPLVRKKSCHGKMHEDHLAEEVDPEISEGLEVEATMKEKMTFSNQEVTRGEQDVSRQEPGLVGPAGRASRSVPQQQIPTADNKTDGRTDDI